MIASQMRIPDLWLKRALALSILPEGSRIDWITNQALGECISGSTATAFKFNKQIAGDNHIRTADELFYLGATLEYLALNGPSEDFRRLGRESVSRYIEARARKLELWPDALAGTFSDFANALVSFVRQRADFGDKGEAYFRKLMAKRLHQELAEALPEDRALPIKIVPGRGLPGEDRIAREPSREQMPFRPKDTIQFLIPPAEKDQQLMGFELRTDDSVVSKPWPEAGNWHGPKHQMAGKAGHLLDHDADVASETGTFWVQAVGVDAGALANKDQLPEPMRKLIKDAPADWPPGYAKTMALVTYVRRAAESAVEAKSKAARLGEAIPADADAPLRLYRGSYAVVNKP
ncbi:MAG TPA: hypothetical protein VII56_12755 [Rhizomicrobium sp.]